MLRIIHNAGFFSCCSIRICKIIQYFMVNKILPEDVDTSGLFNLYKKEDRDITFDFFENYNNDISVQYNKHIEINVMNYQFDNYKTVDYESILPFVKKYFTPSNNIINIQNNLISKYNINTDNCIGLYYRGTDKITETELDSFDSYYNKLTEITNINSSMMILIQTDSSQFLDFMKNKCKDKNIIIINELSTSYNSFGVHLEKKSYENYIDIMNLFAVFLIISKCKYIICSSSNCSIWIMYYRQIYNLYNNFYQNLNKQWL